MSASAHSLATELATQARIGNILLVGIGNGRNLPPFLSRQDPVTVVDADARRLARATSLLPPSGPLVRFIAAAFDKLPFADASFAAVLSTHVLQHGTKANIFGVTRELARVTKPAAICYFVFASQRDRRCGEGEVVGEDCWAPTTGDEIGVPHSYFAESGVYALLQDAFNITSMEEFDADAIVGKWAHTEPSGVVHWFVKTVRAA